MRHTAATAKALPREERAARLRALVASGRISDRQVGMIDLRELTTRERQIGEALARRRPRKAVAL